jgi:hypothetical protein
MLVNSDQGDTFSFEEIRNRLQDVGFERVRTVEAPGLAQYSCWQPSQAANSFACSKRFTESIA